MRVRNQSFYIYLIIWAVVILAEAIDIGRGFYLHGTQMFLTLDFYLDIAFLGFMILLLVALIKSSTKLVLISFAGLITIETIRYFPIYLRGINAISRLNTNPLETMELLSVVVNAFIMPWCFIVYTLTYIFCMVLYFMNHRLRHKIITIVCSIGVVILVAELASISLSYMQSTEGFDFFDLFLDLVFAVFFHVIYIYLPRLMHNHNL